MVLNLKLLLYRHADEIEKLWKIKADFDAQLLDMLQQVKGLSESNIALRQELDELKVAAKAVVDLVDVAKDLGALQLVLLRFLLVLIEI